MKITGTTLQQATAVRRPERSRAPRGGAFAAELAGDAAPTATTATAALGMNELLLSIQEVGDDRDGRRRARLRAETILDRLDELRHALLAGRIAPARLGALVELVRRQRDQVVDLRLAEVLDAIDLRARVELAKLGQEV